MKFIKIFLEKFYELAAFLEIKLYYLGTLLMLLGAIWYSWYFTRWVEEYIRIVLSESLGILTKSLGRLLFVKKAANRLSSLFNCVFFPIKALHSLLEGKNFLIIKVTLFVLWFFFFFFLVYSDPLVTIICYIRAFVFNFWVK